MIEFNPSVETTSRHSCLMPSSEKSHCGMKTLNPLKILYLLEVIKVYDKLQSKKISFTLNKLLT